LGFVCRVWGEGCRVFNADILEQGGKQRGHRRPITPNPHALSNPLTHTQFSSPYPPRSFPTLNPIP